LELIRMKLIDGLQNLVAQIATGKSKAQHDKFAAAQIADDQLIAMYCGDWMARKIIDMPVADMLRPWRAWQASPEQITAIEAAEKRHFVKAKVAQAMRAARLYGGAGIIIGADTANPAAPLNRNAIGRGGLKYLAVVPRRMLASNGLETNIESEYFNRPKSYQFSTSYNGVVEIHPTRVLRFIGNERLAFDTDHDGWADSLLLAIYDAIHNAALTQSAIAELIHEAKIDVISVPNLGAALSSQGGTNDMAKRFANAAALKSINNMLLLDAEEKWDRKQTSFAGLTDVLRTYLEIVAGAADIPATKLLGTAAKGLNATGEGDLTNYYDSLAGERDEAVQPVMDILDDILWRDATGAPKPADVFCEWRPLWQMSAKDQSAVAKAKAETSKIYVDLGILPDDVMAQGIANQLIEDAVYPGIEAELAKVQSAEPSAGEDETESDNPPADRSVERRRA